MTYWDAILLGIIQGLTEFLPISSSGHLVLSETLLGVKQAGVSFELLVHLGTLVAVLVYFRRAIGRMLQSLYHSDRPADRRMILLLIVGTIPAAVIGLWLEDFFEAAFSNPLMTSAMLLVTGFLLLSTRFVPKGDKSPGWLSAVIMGIGQAMAIMPGISRSGSTISFGLFAGVKPAQAAEFSFLLAVPAIAGAVVLKSPELAGLDASLLGPYLVGALFAFLAGLFAVYAVLEVIKRGKFEYFAYYCFAAGALGLYLFL
jgi:undecaprenyl-diphosphatase